jgi:hypothetical protein
MSSLLFQPATREASHTQSKVRVIDKLFWVAARPFWSAWKQSRIVGVTSTDDALALNDTKIAIHGEARESVHLFAGAWPLNLDFINPRGASGS